MSVRVGQVFIGALIFQMAFATSVEAGRPAGVGPNLHRSFMIRRAQRRAAAGRPVPKHVGIWLGGGYNSTVLGADNPYRHGRGVPNSRGQVRTVPPQMNSQPIETIVESEPASLRTETLWSKWPSDAPYQNPFALELAKQAGEPSALPLQTSHALPSPAEEVSPRLMELVQRTAEAFRSGNDDARYAALETLWKEFPEHPESYHWAALDRFQNQDYLTAAELAHVALSSGQVWTWNRVRWAYNARKPYTEQLRQLEQAAGKNPQQSRLRFLLGYHYLMLGHGETAAAQFEHELEQIPGDDLTKELMAILK